MMAPSRRTDLACTARTRSRRTQLSRPCRSHEPVPMEIHRWSPAWSLLESMSATNRSSWARPMTATGRSLPTASSSSYATQVQTISPGSASRSSSGLYSKRRGPRSRRHRLGRGPGRRTGRARRVLRAPVVYGRTRFRCDGVGSRFEGVPAMLHRPTGRRRIGRGRCGQVARWAAPSTAAGQTAPPCDARSGRDSGARRRLAPGVATRWGWTRCANGLSVRRPAERTVRRGRPIRTGSGWVTAVAVVDGRGRTPSTSGPAVTSTRSLPLPDLRGREASRSGRILVFP